MPKRNSRIKHEELVCRDLGLKSRKHTNTIGRGRAINQSKKLKRLAKELGAKFIERLD